MQAALKFSTERREDARFDLIFECIGTHIKVLFKKYESNGQNGNQFFTDVVTAIRTSANGDTDILAALDYLDANTLIQECRNRFNPPPPPPLRSTPPSEYTPRPTHPPLDNAPLQEFENKLNVLITLHRDEIILKLSENFNQAVQFLSREVEKNDDFYQLRQGIAIRYRLTIITRLLKHLEQQKL